MLLPAAARLKTHRDCALAYARGKPPGVHAALLLASVLALGEVVSRASAIDGEAVRDALEVRGGDEARTWDLAIDDGSATGEVRVALTRGDERIDRTFVLAAEDEDGRNRELAAALALVIEQHAAENPAPGRTRPSKDDATPQGWLALGGRLGVGSPADPDGGATLRGGALWGRRHVQPIAQVASVHARAGDLRIDGVRTGVGIAFGTPIRAWWIGGAAIPQLSWLRARDRRTDDDVGLVTEITGLAQWRARRFIAGLRLGVDVTTPPVRARGRSEHLRLGIVRFVAAVEVGFTLPWR